MTFVGLLWATALTVAWGGVHSLPFSGVFMCCRGWRQHYLCLSGLLLTGGGLPAAVAVQVVPGIAPEDVNYTALERSSAARNIRPLVVLLPILIVMLLPVGEQRAEPVVLRLSMWYCEIAT